MLAAQEDIASKIVDLAQKKNMTVYQTVNDILEQALRVEELGLPLQQVIDEREMIERAKETGVSFTIEHLFYEAMEIAYQENPEKITALWREIGKWYGNFFKMKFDDPLKALEDALQLLTLGPPEYSIEFSKIWINVSLVGEKFTKGYSELFASFIEEIMLVLGYPLYENEVKKGLIKLRFRRR
jgi:hypothetical protein